MDFKQLLIIGIALILSLSNGVQEYIDKTERETLSSYPLTINKTTYNMGSDIRQFIIDHGGTLPEDLPTPDKSIKELTKGESIKIEENMIE